MPSPSPRHRVGCVDYESARGECAYKIYYPTTAVPSSRPWSRPPNVETWLAYYGMTVFMFGVAAAGPAAATLDKIELVHLVLGLGQRRVGPPMRADLAVALATVKGF